MKRPQSDFIKELEGIAQEQRKLAETEIIPDWLKGVGEWLVVNPWRLLLPLAGILYLLLRMVGGAMVREVILGLFGGFRL